MNERILSKSACALLVWAVFTSLVNAKGPPADIRITLDGPGSSVELYNSADLEDMDLFAGSPIGTILLNEGEVVTVHLQWDLFMGGQDVSFYGEDTTWAYWGFSGAPACSVGPIGELRIYSMGIEWGFAVDLVLATPDDELHPVAVHPFMRLGGAFREDEYNMGSELCLNGLLPLTEPYSAMGWLPEGPGGETTTPEVLAPQTYSSNNVVDWVLLELRDASDPSIVVARKCGLLRANTVITAEDGESPVTFMAPYGHYYLAVRHRNHLGAMTATPFNAMSLPTDIWLGDPAQVMNGQGALVSSELFSYYGLRPGNVPSGGQVEQVSYTGSQNDRDAVLMRLNGNVNATITGYYAEDLNLDGVVSYTNAHNDREVILGSLPEANVNSIELEQLP